MSKLRAKKMSKSTIAVIIMAIAMAVVFAFAGAYTYAYFTATANAQGAKFTTGYVRLSANGGEYTEEVAIEDVLPGQDIVSTPIKLSVSTTDENGNYIAFKVTFSGTAGDGATTISNVEEVVGVDFADHWKELTDGSGIYIYVGDGDEAAAYTDTEDLLICEELTLSKDVSSDATESNIYGNGADGNANYLQGATLSVKIEARSIQASVLKDEQAATIQSEIAGLFN